MALERNLSGLKSCPVIDTVMKPESDVILEGKQPACASIPDASPVTLFHPPTLV